MRAPTPAVPATILAEDRTNSSAEGNHASSSASSAASYLAGLSRLGDVREMEVLGQGLERRAGGDVFGNAVIGVCVCV